MRAVNLIPPEDRRGDRAPLRTGPLSYAVVAVLLLAFIGVYMLVSTGNSVSENQAQVASLEQQLSSTQARAEALKSFSEFASVEQARTETVSSLAHSRFDWERVMRELALVIPAGISLTTLSGSVGTEAASAGGTGAASAIEAPTLAMSGCAPGQASVAGLVAALRDIDGVTRVGLASSSRASEEGASSGPASSDSGADCDGVTFELTVAFDRVQLDSATGGIVPEPQPGSGATPGDGSGVAETEAERRRQEGRADAAGDQAREAVNRYVPGT